MSPHDMGRIVELDYLFGIRGGAEARATADTQRVVLGHPVCYGAMGRHKPAWTFSGSLPAETLHPTTLSLIRYTVQQTASLPESNASAAGTHRHLWSPPPNPNHSPPYLTTSMDTTTLPH